MSDGDLVSLRADQARLRADLDALKGTFDRQTNDLRRAIESDKGWRHIDMDTWRLVAFAVGMVALLTAGVIGGMYLSTTGYFPTTTQLARQGASPEGFQLTFSQTLSAFIPGVLLVFTAFFGFVGVKRLQAYDAEIREARREQREQMNYATTQQREQLRQMYDEQREFERSVRDIVKTQADDAVSKALESGTKRSIDAISEIERRIDTRKTEIDSALDDYAWLKSASQGQRDALRHGQVSSAGQAHELITELMSHQDVATALAIANRAAADPNVGGAPEDWFNISAELARHNQELDALKVCQRGLRQDPNNIDLLSHALQFATKLGNWEEAERYHQALLAQGLDTWNWRGFVFVSDYLVARNKIDEAIEICGQFSKVISTDERAYSQIAQIWTKLGRTDKVVAICEQGMSSVARGSQIGLLLADGLIELGRYDDALSACDDALAGTAEMQPSANIWGVVWRRGSVFDIKALMSLRDNSPNGLADALDFARKAVANYRATDIMPGALSAIRSQTRTRLLVLRTRLTEAGASETDLGEIFGSDDNGSDDAAKAALMDLLGRVGGRHSGEEEGE